LLLALGVTALVLGDATVVRLGDHLADAVPARHGFADSIRHLTMNPDGGGAAAVIGSVLIASLYGEGLVRALDRLSRHGGRSNRGLRGRLMSPLLILLFAGVLAIALMLSAQLPRPGGGSWASTLLAVYLSFLIGWAAATAMLVLVYRAFSAERPSLRALLWGSAATGSWLSGQTLGFVYVISLPLQLGKPFGGSDAVGTVAVVGFWLYFSHLVMLVGYLLVLRLDARRGRPLGPVVKPSDVAVALPQAAPVG